MSLHTMVRLKVRLSSLHLYKLKAMHSLSEICLTLSQQYALLVRRSVSLSASFPLLSSAWYTMRQNWPPQQASWGLALTAQGKIIIPVDFFIVPACFSSYLVVSWLRSLWCKGWSLQGLKSWLSPLICQCWVDVWGGDISNGFKLPLHWEVASPRSHAVTRSRGLQNVAWYISSIIY